MPINKKNRLTRSKVLVEARDITFTYDNKQFVLKQTSLQIEEGRLVGLIGANGSGKSTLVRLLAGLLHPTSGKVYFGGQSLMGISKQCLARSLAYVPQINPMFFPFTALEVVLTGKTDNQSEVVKKYSFTRNSHLISIEQTVKNLTSENSHWRQYNTLERGEETGGSRMLPTYTGAAFYGEEKKFNPRLQVSSAEEYAQIMNNLVLENPKLMDVAVPTNKNLGMSLDQQKKLNGLSVIEAKKIINNKDCCLIDLREDSEIERQGSINGSIQVSFNKLPDYLHKKRKELTKTKLFFYCAVGERSALAVQLCQSYKLTNTNHLIGGIKKWQE